MRIAGIVVTHNRKALLLENIQCLLRQTLRENLDIVIVDNNSTDGTAEALVRNKLDEEIIYLNTGTNLGGAGGFQFGVKYATEHNYDYIWLMDDDCMPRSASLEQLMIAANRLDYKFGFLSSQVLWTNGKLCTMNVQRKTVTKAVADFNSTSLVRIDMASFVSLLIPTKIVRQVGLPIKEFFIWTDDWEYTRRISRMVPCYLVNSSVVVHKSASNIGANIASDSVDRLPRFRYLYRNDVYLYRREGLQGFLYEFFRLIDHALRVIFRAKDNKWHRLSYIINGTIEGFHFNPSIEFPNERSNQHD